MHVFLLVSRAVWRQRNFGLLWGALLGALAFLSIRFTPLWRVRDFPATSPAGLEPPLEDTSAAVPNLPPVRRCDAARGAR